MPNPTRTVAHRCGDKIIPYPALICSRRPTHPDDCNLTVGDLIRLAREERVAGLRRAAEIARAEPADDRDAMLLQQRIANAILRECGEGGQ